MKQYSLVLENIECDTSFTEMCVFIDKNIAR